MIRSLRTALRPTTCLIRGTTSFDVSEAQECHVGLGQLDQYRRNGWCIPSYRLPPKALGVQQAALERLLAANPHTRPEELVNAHLLRGSGDAVLGDAAFLALGTDLTLASIAATLLGTPDVILWACHVFCKPAGTGRRVPLHQDGQYWPIEPLAATTIWVALDPSDVSNGCLHVCPGSHRVGVLPHETVKDDAALQVGVRADALAALGAPVSVELQPGQLSAHHAMLVHGSEANRSQRRRTGVAYHYMAATAHFDRGGPKASQPASRAFGYETRPLFWVLGARCNPLNSLVRDSRPGRACSCCAGTNAGARDV